MKKINIIVAMTDTFLIGIKETIPWTLSDDFTENFVPKTKNNPIIMGRKTYETLKKPLKDRVNIVLSKNIKEEEKREGFIFVDNVYDAVKIAEASPGDTIWCIGGAEIYKLFQNLFRIEEYHITVVDYFTATNLNLNKDDRIIFIPNLVNHKLISTTKFEKRNPNSFKKYDKGNEYSFNVYTFKECAFNAPIF